MNHDRASAEQAGRTRRSWSSPVWELLDPAGRGRRAGTGRAGEVGAPVPGPGDGGRPNSTSLSASQRQDDTTSPRTRHSPRYRRDKATAHDGRYRRELPAQNPDQGFGALQLDEVVRHSQTSRLTLRSCHFVPVVDRSQLRLRTSLWLLAAGHRVAGRSDKGVRTAGVGRPRRQLGDHRHDTAGPDGRARGYRSAGYGTG